MPSEILRLPPPAVRARSTAPASIPAGVLTAPDVQDLVFSYLRLADPRLKAAAIAAIRAMAQDERHSA